MTNSFADPERIVLAEPRSRPASPKFDYAFPPLSLTVLKWEVRKLKVELNRSLGDHVYLCLEASNQIVRYHDAFLANWSDPKNSTVFAVDNYGKTRMIRPRGLEP